MEPIPRRHSAKRLRAPAQEEPTTNDGREQDFVSAKPVNIDKDGVKIKKKSPPGIAATEIAIDAARTIERSDAQKNTLQRTVSNNQSKYSQHARA